ncbi:hypothetical protein Nepgr_012523 [Nepenthes gracilis]|uniref:Uncharacterized protein n=1 Tax=Nepenthes gracilis TaxID=150966 RepID=A0AAD3SHF6_NEPGR|nr:hypothetical protein Nepgr_012523 [Nepenthes gracilis]
MVSPLGFSDKYWIKTECFETTQKSGGMKRNFDGTPSTVSHGDELRGKCMISWILTNKNGKVIPDIVLCSTVKCICEKTDQVSPELW